MHLAWANDKFVSGVEMSNALDISRVAVWKHIKTLVNEGYDIESSPRGYGLATCRDLVRFSLERTTENILFSPSIDSTMDEARRLAREGVPHFTVVIAEQQTKGRGRLNRAWSSQKGGLWFTIILRPDLPPQLSFKVNFAASLCLAKTLNQLFNINAKVKWPNDILINNQKLVGLLSEMETRGDMISFVNVGIGINVNNQPEKEQPNAVSISTLLGQKVSRTKILAAFLDRFQRTLDNILERNIIELWKEQTATIGRQVRIETFKDHFQGLALDVDDTGALILMDEDHTTRRVIYGDCFYQETQS
ncbi:BirA [Desulforapulum autotrophicum HRM2]|uniref:Bifunctional ligase/repressor BirA n=2 Tax=Desulforapulum autotrophicum TaxID=2296 RepID=C0QI50_DESAH|nr:BirA [Desulforapulum autotrophicum HRM2]